MTETTTAIGYLRISTSRQRFGSQQGIIEDWAKDNGVTVASWHADCVNGAAPLRERPGLSAALEAMKEHGAGMLLVARRDRLARDVIVAQQLDALVCLQGARVLSVAGEVTASANDGSATFVRHMLQAAARYRAARLTPERVSDLSRKVAALYGRIEPCGADAEAVALICREVDALFDDNAATGLL